MITNKIWEILGKISLIATILGAIVAFIAFIIDIKSNPYNIKAKYKIYDYYLDNETVQTIIFLDELINEVKIKNYLIENKNDYEIESTDKEDKRISSLLYWYLKNNWNYSFSKNRINERIYGIYVIELENNSDVSLKDPYINTNMDNAQAFIRYWDGSVDRVSFKNTLKLKEIKSKDKIKIFIWKSYGVYPSDMHLVFENGSIEIDCYYEVSSKKEIIVGRILSISLILTQFLILGFFIYKLTNRKT